MLAQTSDPFDSKDHFFEPKWDGMRCIAYVGEGRLELQNRNLANVTKSYPELAAITSNVKSKNIILDGEIVLLDKGLPSFDLLQSRFGVDDPTQAKRLSTTLPTTYVAFDLLHLNGTDLINRPLSERRKKMEALISDGPHILVSQYITENGRAYFKNALKLGFEGAMAKRVDSQYLPGIRSENWLKLKLIKTIDAIVTGYTVGRGGRSTSFGALVLAAYDRKGNLTHLGNVGTGFTDRGLQKIMDLLKPLEKRSRTICGEVKANAPVKWVKPKLVVEVGYTNLTRDHKLRMPRLMRLRFDKKPSECKT
jgi:DNA ligase D-like protein (predicted ligase)